jgi:1,4-alpha-glucan branching enzyme
MVRAKTPKTKVTFSYHSPQVQSVRLAGDFTGWQRDPLPLKRDHRGNWKKTVALPAGRYEYRLIVDGEWRDDPNCPNREPNPYGGENCVCIIPETRPPEGTSWTRSTAV